MTPTHPEHESLYGRARDGVAVLSPEWRIRYANASLLEILGLIGRPAGGDRLWDALPDWERSPEAELLRRAMTQRERTVFRVARERGAGRIWEVTAEPVEEGLRVRLHNATGAAGSEAAERDAGARGTGAVEQERRALFDILDALPVGVVVAEAGEGRTVYLNPAAAELGGRPREALAAERMEEYAARWGLRLPTGEAAAGEELPLAHALRGETVREAELVIRRPDGAERTILASAVPLRGAHGAVERAMVAFYDITERLALERELVERTAEAEHAAANAALRAEEGRALREMGRALVSILEPDRVLRLAGESAMELLGARGSFVATPLDGGGRMRIAPGMGVMEPLDGAEAPLPGSVAERTLASGTQLFNALDALPPGSPFREALAGAGVRNLLLVPMRAFGEPLGVLGVVDRSGGFAGEDARLLEAFADSAALAVHNARLYAAERRRSEVNRALLAAAEILTSTLDPEEVMERIVILAEELVGADGAALALLEGEEGETTRIAVASGIVEALRGLRGSTAGGLTEGALRRGAPSVIHPRGDERAGAVGLVRLGVEACAVCPLQAGEERLGVLALVRGDGRPPFSEEALRALSLLGAQAALAVRNARLYRVAQQASRAKGDFLAMMSHELRTPLNALEGYAALLGDGIYGPLNEAQHTAVQRMRSAQAHLVELIDQVLDVAQVEAGTRRVKHAPVRMRPLVEEAAETFRAAAEARGLRLEVEAQEVGEVRTDAGMIRQVLVNLVGNALKFTEAGGVAVRLRREDSGVAIEVADTGAGIPPELRERVFEPFFQADASTTRTAGGVGLGLALSRDFATMLGGELSVESEPGVGSTFTLRLPPS